MLAQPAASILLIKPLFSLPNLSLTHRCSSPVGAVPSTIVLFLLLCVVANHSCSPGPGPVLLWKTLRHEKVSLSWTKCLRPEEMHMEGGKVWSTKTAVTKIGPECNTDLGSKWPLHKFSPYNRSYPSFPLLIHGGWQLRSIVHSSGSLTVVSFQRVGRSYMSKLLWPQ